MMFLPTNMDILLFKKQIMGRQTLNGYNNQNEVTLSTTNTLRDNWTKTEVNSTENEQAQPKTQERTILTDNKFVTNKSCDNTRNQNMVQQDTTNNQLLSITHSIGAKVLNQHQASAVSNINYYLPQSDNFTGKMASTLKQAITEN